MKTCPQCGSTYPDEKKFCQRDGQMLAGFHQAATVSPLPPTSSGSREAVSKDGSMVGKVLAERYRIQSLLGKGGMGEVYKAEHTMLGRLSAVKVILPESAQNEDTLARFKREAEMASKINHPNAVAIHDFGETEDGLVFLAMEYIEGKPLTDILKAEAPLSPERVVNITKQVADALNAAHALNIVHRDLKPDNIMICPGDVVKVVDFGIAKSTLLDEQHRQVTRTGFIVGTPQYMSPEQILGEKLDSRSDIYSLGLVVYEMLTSTVPFEGESAQAQMVNRLAVQPLPLRQARPGLKISGAMEAVVMKALMRERELRYSTALEFSTQLEQAFQAGTQDIPRRVTDGAVPGPTQFVAPVPTKNPFQQGMPSYPMPQPAQAYPTPPLNQPPPPSPPFGAYQQPPSGSPPFGTYQQPPSGSPPFGTYQQPPSGSPPFGTYQQPPFRPVSGQAPFPQPGFGPPSIPPQPLPPPPPLNLTGQRPLKKKSKAPLIVGILFLLLVVGGGFGGFIYYLSQQPSNNGGDNGSTGGTETKLSVKEQIQKRITRSRELREDHRFSDAYDEMDQALKLDQDSSAALIEKAEIYAEQGKWPEAEDLVYRVIKKDPDFAPARQNLGVIYSRQGKKQEAIKEQKRTLELNPEPEYACYAHSVLASIYSDQFYSGEKKDWSLLDNAEREALAALKNVPRKSLAISPHTTLATIYIERKDYDKANDHAEQILNIKTASKTELASAHNQLGLVHFYKGEYTQAETEFKKAADLDPNRKVYKDNIEAARKKQNEGLPLFPGGSIHD